MKVISETVNTYYFIATKVVRSTHQDEYGHLIETKKVYVLGIKVFESSTHRERSLRDSIMQAWGGEIQ